MTVRRLLRRIAFRLLTAWAVVTVNFLIPRLMWGDPVQAALQAFQSRRTHPSRAAMEWLEVALGVLEHQSLWFRYLSQCVGGTVLGSSSLEQAPYGLEKIEHQLVVIPEFLRVAA
jgi:ABC-type dipeptide/oligopeptide/nickel transport system permease component